MQGNKMHFPFILDRKAIISLYLGLPYFKEFSVKVRIKQTKEV